MKRAHAAGLVRVGKRKDAWPPLCHLVSLRRQPLGKIAEKSARSCAPFTMARACTYSDATGLDAIPVRDHPAPVRIIALATLREFWCKHPDAETPLRAWHADAEHANWRTPADIKAAHRNASFVANGRVVFNIKGNAYRLVAAVHYNRGLMFVRFVGTHADYDRIDVATV